MSKLSLLNDLTNQTNNKKNYELYEITSNDSVHTVAVPVELVEQFDLFIINEKIDDIQTLIKRFDAKLIKE